MKLWAAILTVCLLFSCNERSDPAPNYSTVDSNAIDPPDSPVYDFPDSLHEIPLDEGPVVQPEDTVTKRK